MYRFSKSQLQRALSLLLAGQGPRGHDVMKVASDKLDLSPGFQLRDLSGPAAAVLITLAGAALVAVGLLLVGMRDGRRTRVCLWRRQRSVSVTASESSCSPN